MRTKREREGRRETREIRGGKEKREREEEERGRGGFAPKKVAPPDVEERQKRGKERERERGMSVTNIPFHD